MCLLLHSLRVETTSVTHTMLPCMWRLCCNVVCYYTGLHWKGVFYFYRVKLLLLYITRRKPDVIRCSYNVHNMFYHLGGKVCLPYFLKHNYNSIVVGLRPTTATLGTGLYLCILQCPSNYPRLVFLFFIFISIQGKVYYSLCVLNNIYKTILQELLLKLHVQKVCLHWNITDSMLCMYINLFTKYVNPVVYVRLPYIVMYDQDVLCNGLLTCVLRVPSTRRNTRQGCVQIYYTIRVVWMIRIVSKCTLSGGISIYTYKL